MSSRALVSLSLVVIGLGWMSRLRDSRHLPADRPFPRRPLRPHQPRETPSP